MTLPVQKCALQARLSSERAAVFVLISPDAQDAATAVTPVLWGVFFGMMRLINR